jgi:UV DNA damage endonuclease
MIRLGYACINTELPSSGKTFRLANYSENRMLEVATANLAALQAILRWNLDHHIFLFRITSDLIPFGSHPINTGAWKRRLKKEFTAIGRFITGHGMRVSMHPGQYTVLNSPDQDTYARALEDLAYQTTILDLMTLGASHKIILHGGGAYGDKATSTRRLTKRIEKLARPVKRRLVLENDERVFTAQDILTICENTGLPGIFDVFHHQVLPSFTGKSIRSIIGAFRTTWKGDRQKIHYSDQGPGKNPGAHSQKIDFRPFSNFYQEIKDLDLDIMLEVKNKQTSLLELRKKLPDL